MENNINLRNAVVIGENPDTAFIIENNHLHAVEQSVADLKKDKSDSKQLIPLMREALKALVIFAKGKVEPHFLEIDWKALSSGENEQEELIGKIHHIFSHLPHHDRNDLSALVHHKQTTAKRK